MKKAKPVVACCILNAFADVTVGQSVSNSKQSSGESLMGSTTASVHSNSSQIIVQENGA